MFKAVGITSGIVTVAVLSLLLTPWFLMLGLGIAHAGYSPIPALGFEACAGICISLFAAGAAWRIAGGSGEK